MTAAFSECWKQAMFVDEAAIFSAIAGIAPPAGASDFFRMLIDRFGDATAGALDLGCGNGRMGKAIAPLVPFYIGSDLSPPLIAQAYKTRTSNQFFVRGDFRNLVADHDIIGICNVFRCYTSLGYFSFDEERDLLTDLRRIVPRGLVLLDTFDAAWFRKNRRLSRSRDLPDLNIVFEESYVHKSGAQERVEAIWNYVHEDKPRTEIAFDLDCYDRERVQLLAALSGWRVAEFYSDYAVGSVYPAHKQPRERLIAVLV